MRSALTDLPDQTHRVPADEIRVAQRHNGGAKLMSKARQQRIGPAEAPANRRPTGQPNHAQR
jgi:hypothetical protein